MLRFRPLPLSSQWMFRLLAVVLLLSLSIKYKEVGIESIRPFHSAGLILLAIAGLYCALFRLPVRFHCNPISILIYVCAAYLFCAGAVAGERGFKDGVYLVANSVAVYWLIASVIEAITINRFLDEASIVARMAGVVIAFPTIIIWVWPIVGMGILVPSPSYLARAHGILGDPTNFGCFCSAALLFVAARLTSASEKGGNASLPADQVIMAILMLGVIASGSRMALLGGTIGFAVLLAFGQLRMKAALAPMLASALLYPALLYLKASALTAGTIEGQPTFAENQSVMGQLAQGAFRFEEGGSEARLGLLNFAIDSFLSLPISERLTGCGYQCIESLGRSSHIGYLDMLVNYGLIFLGIMCALLAFSTVAGILLARRGAALPLALLAFFMSATAFLSWPFNTFFNYPFFCALIAFACLAASRLLRFSQNFPEPFGERSTARALYDALAFRPNPR